MNIKNITIFLLLLSSKLFSDWVPHAEIANPYRNPSLVNSVDFHPTKNLFCVTFSQNQSVAIYQIDGHGDISVYQLLDKPISKMSCPQHALFSKDGSKLLVINWCNQTFCAYDLNDEGYYQETPSSIISFSELQKYRPHGIAFNNDSTYLAVAYGASELYLKAIALYRVENLGNS